MQKLSWLALFGLLVTVTARGGIILGTDLTSGFASSGSVSVDSTQFVTQPFSLNTSEHITDISLEMAGFGTDTFTLWLTDADGPGTLMSSVLFQRDLTFPNTGSGLIGATVAASTDLLLTPGTYFLIVSSGQPSASQGWIVASSTLPGGAGSIAFGAASCCMGGSSTNTRFAPASSFAAVPGNHMILAFQLDGLVPNAPVDPPVPEPGTLVLLSAGSICLLGLRRMRLPLARGPQRFFERDADQLAARAHASLLK